MYNQMSHGGRVAFWGETWRDDLIEEAIRFCAVGLLRPLIQHYAPAGTRLLKGVCGRGHYVAYYSARGVQVTGCTIFQSSSRRLPAVGPSAPPMRWRFRPLPRACERRDESPSPSASSWQRIGARLG